MKAFNIRVYGIIINPDNEILVSDEYRFGRAFTKFPGGGLEWGEGTREALEREMMEEMNLEVEVGELFYVNDFFQRSSFRETDQILSFYYRIKTFDVNAVPVTAHEVPLTEDGEKFRWIPLSELNESIFTFPIDKVVSRKLADQ